MENQGLQLRIVLETEYRMFLRLICVCFVDIRFNLLINTLRLVPIIYHNLYN